MVGTASRRGKKRASLLAACGLALAAAAVALWWGQGETGTVRRSIDGEPLIDAVPVTSAEPMDRAPILEVRGSIDGVVAVPPGATVHLDQAAVEARGDGAVRFELEIPVPLTSDEPRAVHLLPIGRPGFEMRSLPPSGARDRVRIDVPADALRQPGRYVVNVETTEDAHFPVRRFAIEVD